MSMIVQTVITLSLAPSRYRIISTYSCGISMASPAFFKDFNKPVDTVLKDDYTEKKNVKIRFVTPNGIIITSENDIVGNKSVVASLSAKWRHAPTGFSIDKLQLQKDTNVVAEVSLAGVAPGLGFTFKGVGATSGEIGVEYTGPKFAVKSDLDIGLEKNRTSAVVAYEGAKLGAEVDLNLPSEKKSFELGPWRAGVAYGSPSFFTSVVTTNGKVGLDTTLYGLYRVSGPLALAGTLTKPALGSQLVFTVGGVYKVNPKATLKAKVDAGGQLDAVVIQDVMPKVTLTSSISLPIKSPADYKLGFGAVLG